MINKIKKPALLFLVIALVFGNGIASMNLAKAEEQNSELKFLLDNQLVKKPSEAGKLQIINKDGGKTLADKDGNPIQLRGMSTHGLQWFPEIINDNAFKALANDWESNMIRLAMYIGETGYATNPEVKDKVIEGIDLAIANDMYVIVDWHVHGSPGDPNAEMYSGALDFFEEIAELYPNNPHLIYELANEPNPGEPGVTNDASGWEAVKSYAEPIIEMLRDNGNENTIIVGSPNWSQRPDLAADNPIDDDNTMYSVHFYTGTHHASEDSVNRENVMANARYALENGVAVFASEWGTSEASGHNGPYLDEADVWLNFLNENNISWVNWSLTNKNETSGSFMPFELGKQDATNLNPGDDQIWETSELSLSGEYVRARIKGIEYEPIDRIVREEFSTVVWDFNDGTTQGFDVNADSPVKDVMLNNEDNMLKISGLSSSNDVSEENYWANVRLSTDIAPEIDIYGAEELTIDVIVAEPTTVSIAAIPQTDGEWVNPNRAIQVTADDFNRQEDGTYKANLTISSEDAPSLEGIGTNNEKSLLNNTILFVGAENTDIVFLDNITVSGNRAAVEQPVEHAELGEATLPSDFEDLTRQGWVWDQASGVKSELSIAKAAGSNTLSWEFAYPEVKPDDDWASAPRLMLPEINVTRGDNDYLVFDLYLDPVRGTEGALSINLAFAPPSLGYWAQARDSFDIDLGTLDEFTKTEDELYHVKVEFDLNNIGDDKVIDPDTILRDIIILFADVESDFAGRIYVDNVNFTNDLGEVPVDPEVPAGNGAGDGDGDGEDDGNGAGNGNVDGGDDQNGIEDGERDNETDSNRDPVTVEDAEEDGGELPKTATSTFNWILAGGIFLLTGIVFTIIAKRGKPTA